jgi:hypothetical protein
MLLSKLQGIMEITHSIFRSLRIIYRSAGRDLGHVRLILEWFYSLHYSGDEYQASLTYRHQLAATI